MIKLKHSLLASSVALGVLATAIAQTPPAATPPAAAPAAPQFTEAQAFETYGWYIGKNTGFGELEFTQEQVDAIVKGMMLARDGKDAPYEIEKIGPEIQKILSAKQEAYMAKQKDQKAAESEKFFAEIKKKPGVVTLPSGLMYEITKPGDGAYPKSTDVVKVHYTGKLVDGTTFDTSLEPRQPGAPVEPVEFALDGVIPGWTEGIQKINKGGKITLYIPAELGYGGRATPTIPAWSTLVFDVELLDVKPAPAAEPAPQPAAQPAPAPAS